MARPRRKAQHGQAPPRPLHRGRTRSYLERIRTQPISNLCLWWRENGGRDWLREHSAAELHAMLLDFKPLIDIVKALKSEFEMRPEGR